MENVQKVSQTITPFAGISFINNEFNHMGLGKLIDNLLSIRVSTCGYQYSDIVRSWFDIFLCGRDCAEEDIAQHLRPTLENIPQSKVPSPETLLRSLDELDADNTYDFDYDNRDGNAKSKR